MVSTVTDVLTGEFCYSSSLLTDVSPQKGTDQWEALDQPNKAPQYSTMELSNCVFWIAELRSVRLEGVCDPELAMQYQKLTSLVQSNPHSQGQTPSQKSIIAKKVSSTNTPHFRIKKIWRKLLDSVQFVPLTTAMFSCIPIVPHSCKQDLLIF